MKKNLTTGMRLERMQLVAWPNIECEKRGL